MRVLLIGLLIAIALCQVDYPPTLTKLQPYLCYRTMRAALFVFSLVAFGGAHEAYGTDAFVHMIHVKLARTIGGHALQIMDDAMAGVSNIVEIYSTRTQWCYDIYAGWDDSPDESVCSYTAIPAGNRLHVYVHVVLLFEETVSFPGRFDSRFESI